MHLSFSEQPAPSENEKKLIFLCARDHLILVNAKMPGEVVRDPAREKRERSHTPTENFHRHDCARDRCICRCAKDSRKSKRS
jgi:hypothetical protein